LRAAWAIFIYAVAVVVVGALLAPWVFWGIHFIFPNLPFRRVFDRTMLGVALAGLWPLLRALGVRTWAEVGFRRSSGWWRASLQGVVIGIGSFMALAAVLMAFGYRTFESPLPALFPSVLVFVATGAAVGVIEEIFFRGGVQGALQRASNMAVAVIVGSAIYSAMHFFKSKGIDVEADAVTWVSGFTHLKQVVTNSASVPGVTTGFVTLWLVGCVLGAAYARTGTLYLPIGIHAGWVFTLKCYSLLTKNTGQKSWWGGGILIENLLVWPVLLGVLVLVIVWPRQKDERS
jgi:membrane protease YdiL (CAAX protease family)